MYLHKQRHTHHVHYILIPISSLPTSYLLSGSHQAQLAIERGWIDWSQERLFQWHCPSIDFLSHLQPLCYSLLVSWYKSVTLNFHQLWSDSMHLQYRNMQVFAFHLVGCPFTYWQQINNCDHRKNMYQMYSPNIKSVLQISMLNSSFQ